MDVKGNRWLVVGMARSGVAAARLLEKNGALVVINDAKKQEAFEGALDGLRMLPGIEWCLGQPADSLWQGCAGVVISPGVPIGSPWIAKVRGAGVPVIGELELGYRMSRGIVVAVTGTNGKTTTTSMTGEMMRNAGRQTYVAGNIGIPLCSVAEYTRPGDVLVCEVSSFQLESVTSFHARVAAVLNITPDHLDRHGSLARYIELKRDIMLNQTPGDTVVLNWDDAPTRTLADSAGGAVLFFSRKETLAEGVSIAEDKIVYRWGGVERVLCDVEDLRLPEPHNVENALAAAAIGVALEVPPPVIRHTLRTFQGVEHRLENVAAIEDVRYINDSKGTNVDSTIKAIEAMRAPTVLLLGGSRKDVDYTLLAATVVSSPCIRHVVTLGDTRIEIGDALRSQGYVWVTQCDEGFEQAVRLAKAQAEAGGNVLLSPACASFDMFKDYEERGRVFKDIVKKLAEEAT